jgi:hypothetical protein
MSTITQPTAVIFLREQGERYESCKQAAETLGAQIIRKYGPSIASSRRYWSNKENRHLVINGGLLCRVA